MADTLRDRAGAYRALFRLPRRTSGGLTPPAEIVLRDLMRICYVNKTTAHANPHAMAAAEGRRQVWLHIQRQLSLTDEQINRLNGEGEPLL